MLEAARASVGFYCPGCGAGLRALRADAGSVIDCDRCGEHVRVPRKPHPLESEAEDLPVLTYSAVRTAQAGIRLLLLSIIVLLAEYAFLGLVWTYWVVEAGPAAVALRDTSVLKPVLAVVLALDLVLVSARTILRWLGYRLSEPAATAVGTGGWVSAARISVGLRAVGYAVTCLPLVVDLPLGRQQNLLTAVAETGFLVWLVGATLEFAILVAWHRILVEIGNRTAARRVVRFAISAGLSVLVLSCGLLLLRGMLDATLVRAGAPPTTLDGRVNVAALPPEAWRLVGGFLTLAAGLGLVLCWQYARVLLALRSSLAGHVNR